jgi:hypothetical protein
MKRNFYNLKLKDDLTDTTTPEPSNFFNLWLEKEYFNLACSNGDTLGSVDDIDLLAHNAS